MDENTFHSFSRMESNHIKQCGEIINVIYWSHMFLPPRIFIKIRGPQDKVAADSR